MSDKLRTVVILIVVVVWALNVIAPIFVKDYKPVPELNAAFMGIVGIIVAGRKGGENNNSSDDPSNELAARRSARGEGDNSDSA